MARGDVKAPKAEGSNSTMTAWAIGRAKTPVTRWQRRQEMPIQAAGAATS
jgi:hypothetical protein